MMRPGIEPRSPRPLVNTLPTRPMNPPHTPKCSRYDTKQSNGEVPGMLKLWGMLSSSSLPSIPGQLWPGVVASDRVLSMSQIELNFVLMLNWNVWNRIVLIFNCV